MSATLSLPPRLILRDLMLTTFTHKARIFCIFFVVMALSIALAVLIQPDYKAKSSLLVLMGPEYGVRPSAGQQSVANTSLEAEQMLRTEASIIGSDDLHRTVIRDIGAERLYPKLFEQPTPIQQWLTDTKRYITDNLGLTVKSNTEGSNDPIVKAVEIFMRNLTITVDKKSSVIGLEFTNPDRILSAEALSDLITRYLALRSKLYGDVQAPIVQVQQDIVGKQLATADAALQSFKQQHDISNFSERRAILLREQGDIETAKARAEGSIAAENARLAQLNQQLDTITGTKRGTPNAATALQGMVAEYQRRQELAKSEYRGSPAVDEARKTMLERQTDIARLQATQAYTVQGDRNKTETDLRGSLAAHDSIEGQLKAINRQISDLDAEENALHSLERTRAVLEDNYRAVAKILSERQTVETVEANRQSSVRVVQPPSPPAHPQPTRRLILMAGFVVSALISITSILMSHFFRAIYLRPEALEMDTGLTVLTSVPEIRGIGKGANSILISPS